jgi:hypothetical protein
VRVPRSVLPLALVLAVAGCSSDSGKPALPEAHPSVAAPSTASAPAITDPNAIRTALLTAAELPPGFSQLIDLPSEAPAGPSADSSDKSSTDPARCAVVLSPVSQQQTGSTANASARFGGPGYNSIDVDAASYADVGAAFARVQELVGQCTHYTGTDADGVAVDYRIGGVELPTVGDASTAFRILTESMGITLTTDVVIAVVGSTVMQLTATGQAPIDAGVLTGLATNQVDRLRRATG